MTTKRKTKHRNVTWHKTRKRWYGRFYREGRMIHVGYWPKDELEKAVKETGKAVRKFDREAKQQAEAILGEYGANNI
jgi:hypothetical protein